MCCHRLPPWKTAPPVLQLASRVAGAGARALAGAAATAGVRAGTEAKAVAGADAPARTGDAGDEPKAGARASADADVKLDIGESQWKE